MHLEITIKERQQETLFTGMQKENEKPLAWKPLLKIQMIETILSINSITLEPLIIGLLFEKQRFNQGKRNKCRLHLPASLRR